MSLGANYLMIVKKMIQGSEGISGYNHSAAFQ